MTDDAKGSGEFEPDRKEWERQLQEIEAAQQLYVQQAFKWLIDFITAYFPEDKLAAEDAVTDVRFYQTVVEQKETLGVLVYRFRKFQDKKAFYTEMLREVREELDVPEALFVDTETSRFEAPMTLPEGEPYVEIPPDALAGRIRELREELKKRGKLRKLRDSL